MACGQNELTRPTRGILEAKGLEGEMVLLGL